MVAFSDSPEDIYGKVMSWPDGMIMVGFELLTEMPMPEIAELINQKKPRDCKMILARAVVNTIHGKRAASKAERVFVKTFQKKEMPEDISETTALVGEELCDVLLLAGLVKSKSDFRRLVLEGAVAVRAGENELKITEPHFKIDQEMAVRLGKKRFLKIRLA